MEGFRVQAKLPRGLRLHHWREDPRRARLLPVPVRQDQGAYGRPARVRRQQHPLHRLRTRHHLPVQVSCQVDPPAQRGPGPRQAKPGSHRIPPLRTKVLRRKAQPTAKHDRQGEDGQQVDSGVQ